MLRPAFLVFSALVLLQSSAAIAKESADVAERREKRAEATADDALGTVEGNPKTEKAAEPAPAHRPALPIR